jgi:hypothetical protein
MLTPDEIRSLRALAEIMIPASAEHGVPSAADEVIFADILNSFGRDAAHVLAVVRALDALAGGRFADLSPPQRQAIATRLQEAGGEALFYLGRILLQCYYRDDRVMRSLGLEPRPPYPEGFEVEQGDWSLLDPVRARPEFYRKVP